MITSLLAALLAAAQPAPEAPSPPVPLPGWMAGCWMAEGAGHRTEECWTVPRGEMMLASSHSFVPGDTRAFEHMRIVQEGGTLVFTAQPGGGPATRFELVEHNAQTPGRIPVVAFENRQHDYPQRIIYQLVGGRMVAMISMADGSRRQSWEFRRPGQ